jgi:hypothetical protein
MRAGTQCGRWRADGSPSSGVVKPGFSTKTAQRPFLPLSLRARLCHARSAETLTLPPSGHVRICPLPPCRQQQRMLPSSRPECVRTTSWRAHCGAPTNAAVQVGGRGRVRAAAIAVRRARVGFPLLSGEPRVSRGRLSCAVRSAPCSYSVVAPHCDMLVERCAIYLHGFCFQWVTSIPAS